MTETATIDIDDIGRALEIVERIEGEIDAQTYDQKSKERFDEPPDAERHVMLTARDESELQEARVCLQRAYDVLFKAQAASGHGQSGRDE